MRQAITPIVLAILAIACAACASQLPAVSSGNGDSHWEYSIYPQVDDDGNPMPAVVVGDP